MIHFYRSVTSRTTGLHGAALLVLRVVAGWLIVLHGLAKFDAGTTGFELGVLKPLGLPATALLSVLIPTFEITAGAFLIAGLLTRAVALLLTALMLTTGLWIKLSVWHTGVLGPNGAGGAELDFLYLVLCLVLFAAGPGDLAADSVLGLEHRGTPPARREAPLREAAHQQ